MPFLRCCDAAEPPARRCRHADKRFSSRERGAAFDAADDISFRDALRYAYLLMMPFLRTLPRCCRAS